MNIQKHNTRAMPADLNPTDDILIKVKGTANMQGPFEAQDVEWDGNAVDVLHPITHYAKCEAK